MSLKYSQCWRLHYFCEQPITIKKIIQNVQSVPPIVQFKAVALSLVLSFVTDSLLTATSFQVVVESNDVSPRLPLLQTKQPQFPQPFFICLVFLSCHQLHSNSLHSLEKLHILLMRGPKLNKILDV